MAIVLIMTIATLAALCLVLQLLLDKASTKWPSAKGTLEGFNVRIWTESTKFPSLQGPGTDRCIVSVRYSFEVYGKKYIGKRINFGIDNYFLSPQGYYLRPDEVENNEFTTALKNNDFTVQYWPRFPRFSVLKSGIANHKKYYQVVGLIMGTGIVLCLFYSIVTKIYKP
jgi:hypothetical protein